MHNVKKKQLSVEQQAARRQENVRRAAHYTTLSRAAAARRAARLLDAESLSSVAKVVEINPDHSTMWNFRRECLQAMHGTVVVEGASSSDPLRHACETEFELTQACLMINPKSYPVWFHRMWVLTWAKCDWAYARELKLTTKMLALDERNFHCWTHRRFVARASSVGAEAELKFTTEKIEINFSNYSAWHYRSKLLPQLHATNSGIPRTELVAELQFLRNAFFTSPEDQSAWFYHRWVLAQLTPASRDDASSTSNIWAQWEEVLLSELAMLRELRDLEPEAKWPLASFAYVLKLVSESRGCNEGSKSGLSNAEATELDDALSKLQGIDMSRANFYATKFG